MKSILSIAALASSALCEPLTKRDIGDTIQIAAQPCGGQIAAVQQPCGQTVQVQAVQPQPLQVQAVQSCAQSQPLQVQAVQPCAQSQPLQVQAVRPMQVQAVQPCQVQAVQPPLMVQASYPQPQYYQQPQQQPMYYQPQPQYYQPQPQYYPQSPQYGPTEEEEGCYSSMGNSIAGSVGRFIRYVACPWSFFLENASDCAQDEGPSYPQYGYGGGYGGYYMPPQPQPMYYQPQPQQQQPMYYQPQPQVQQQPMYYQPQPQPQVQQQPQGQWYTTVVPVQNPQNTVLQPVHASLVPDYGLPNGYAVAAC